MGDKNMLSVTNVADKGSRKNSGVFVDANPPLTTKEEIMLYYLNDEIEWVINNQKLLVLDVASSNKRAAIKKLSLKLNGLYAFTVDTNNGKGIALKPHCKISLEIVNGIHKEAERLLKQNLPEKALEKYNDIMIYTYPNASNMYKIGLCYLKLGNKEEALKYFLICESINKHKKSGVSVLKTIDEVRRQLAKKASDEAMVSEEEFYGTDYGINNLEQIVRMVLEEGLNINEVGDIFAINDNQKNVVKLVIAREYYLAGNDFLADKLVKEVERFKGKDQVTRSLFSEVVKNKRLYRNQGSKTFSKKK